MNVLKGSADRILFNQHSRDNCSEPYLKLRNHCAGLGYSFEATRHQSIADCRWLLFWDAASIRPNPFFQRVLFNLNMRKLGGIPRNLLKEAEKSGAREKLALIIYEPLVVCPANSDRTLHERFSIIFTWDPALVDGVKYHKFYLPIPTQFPEVPNVSFAERKFLVNISGNNFVTHECELYTERRNAIRFFQKLYPNDFDLYGTRWNPTWWQYFIRRLQNSAVQWEEFTAYRGPVKNKIDVLPKYKFALCYENCRDQSGFVTEKIFDCMRCRVVPIYWGASDILDYVDGEAFIDRRAFKSLEELAGFLASMSERSYQGYQDAAQNYLQGPKCKLFLSENFSDCIARGLGLASDSTNLS